MGAPWPRAFHTAAGPALATPGWGTGLCPLGGQEGAPQIWAEAWKTRGGLRKEGSGQ